MTINPEKEIKLFFYLEKTIGMPKGNYYVSGSHIDLGDWDLKHALRMRTRKRNGKEFYVNSITVKKNHFPLQYKYFSKMKKGEIVWIGKAFDNYIASEDVFTFMCEMSNKRNSLLVFNTFTVPEMQNYGNSWNNRKEYIIPFIFKSTSDVILFQDISRNKYHFIHHRIDAIYEFIGIDKDDIDDKQNNLIAFNKHKYTINNWGRFWLSTTPGVPDSNDLNNKFPRNCIWASLKKIDEYSCLYFNVELDKINYWNYSKVIDIILQEIEKVIDKNIDDDYIFLGITFYFQTNDNSEILKKISNFGFIEIPFNNTYHGLSGKENCRYDYIFFIEKKEPIYISQSYTYIEESIISKANNIFISDHYPIKIEYMKDYNQ